MPAVERKVMSNAFVATATAACAKVPGCEDVPAILREAIKVEIADSDY